MLINFFSFTILSRLLAPSEYGFVALITVFTGFITIFSDAGLSYAVIRSDYGRTYHKALNNLTLLLGATLFLTVVLLAYPIAWFYEDEALFLPALCFSLLFVFKSWCIVPQAVLNKGLQFNYIGKSQLATNISAAVLSIILAWFGLSYWAIIIPQVLSGLMLYNLLNLRVKLPLKLYPSAYSKAGFKKARWLMKNILGFGLINYWARNADNLLIGKYYSKSDLGIYSKSYSLLTLPLGMISSLFGTILFPSLKDLWNKGGDVRKEYGNVLGIISLVNFPVAAVLILLARPIVDILWGEKWIMAAEFVPYFGLLVITQTLISTSGSYFVLLKKERTMFWLGVCTALIMVGSIIIGIFFSVLDVARFYALGYLVLVVPVTVYVAYYRTFGFSSKFILLFWAPKFIFSLLLYATIWYQKWWLACGVLGLLLLHLLYQQRHDIKSGIRLAYRFSKN